MKTARTIVALAVLCTSFCCLAQEKPTIEVTGTYQFLRSDGLNVPAGWDASVNVPTNSWFGFVGDFGGATQSVSGVNATLYTFGGGPQFTLRSRDIEPYFRFVLGAAHADSSGYGFSGSVTGFLVAPGGGADFRVSDRLSFRLGANYPLIRKSGVTSDGIEALVGITYRLGRKRQFANDVTQVPQVDRSSVIGSTVPSLGVVVDERVRIVRFLPNSVLSDHGLALGDIIKAIGETEIRGPEDLGSATAHLSKGSHVRIIYLIRGEWQSSIEVDF